MFTGIIETIGKVIELTQEDGNLHIVVESSISKELKIDQSVSHNGVCLTVVEQNDNWHKVTAIAETLSISNLNQLNLGSFKVFALYLKKLSPKDHIKGIKFTSNNTIIAGAISIGPLLLGSINQERNPILLFIILNLYRVI